MSPRTFQLHMRRFRFQIAARKFIRGLREQLHTAAPRMLTGLRWMGQVVLAPFWMFFVLAIGLWERIEQRTHSRYHLRTWQRGMYCLGLSLGMGLALALLNGWGVNEFTFLLAAANGLLLFVTWKRGARWFGKLLGVRPVRARNPEDAYAGLDLGN